MRHKRKIAPLILAVLLGGMALSLSACSQAKAYASQCIYVIQKNWFDAKHIKNILHPGQRANSTGDTKRYIYCNARNYLVHQGSQDRGTPIIVRTKTNKDGTPGQTLKVWVDVYWALNQNDAVLRRFLPFCEKYNCFSSPDISGNANYSSAGWNGMLHENFDPALDRAGRDIGAQFDGTLPNEQGQWNSFGDQLAAQFTKQLAIGDGSGSENYFCGQGVSQQAGGGYSCPGINIQVNQIEYQNPQAEDLYQQQTTIDAQKALTQKQKELNILQLEAAQAKYGPGAGNILGQLDIIRACQAVQSCNVILGNGAQIAVQTK